MHKCVCLAWIFVNTMLSLFRQHHNDRRIKLTPKLLDCFLQFLPRFNGTVIFDKTQPVNKDIVHIDASLTGLGGKWRDRVYATPTYPIHGTKTIIIHWEMMNLLMALKVWGRQWAGSHILFFCDNAAVVQVVDSGKTRDPLFAACLRNIWMLTATYDIEISIRHIPGSKYTVSDLFSRLYFDKKVNGELLCYLQVN